MSPPESIPPSRLALYEKVLDQLPDVERKGAKMPYTSLNGHMFSFLTNEGRLALRLPDGDREAFLKKYNTTLCEQHGIVMKEYVLVPDSLLLKTRELLKHFERSLAYVGALKPKSTTRKRPANPSGTKSKSPATQKPAKRK